jgi:hypothetical protein
VTGLSWLSVEDTDRYRRIPAATLSLLGLIAIVAGPAVFRPWEYGGLAFGVFWLWTWLVIGAGAVFLTFGRRWYRELRMRRPLALLASSLAVSWFAVYHDRVLRSVSPLTFALVAVAVVALPFVAVFFGLASVVRDA